VKPESPKYKEEQKREEEPPKSMKEAIGGAGEEELEENQPRRKGTDESVVGGNIGDHHNAGATVKAEEIQKMQASIDAEQNELVNQQKEEESKEEPK
jgi:hypothetical protein